MYGYRRLKGGELDPDDEVNRCNGNWEEVVKTKDENYYPWSRHMLSVLVEEL